MLKDWAHIPARSSAVAPTRVWPLSEAGQPEKAHGEYVRLSVVLQCNGTCITQETSAFACSSKWARGGLSNRSEVIKLYASASALSEQHIGVI